VKTFCLFVLSVFLNVEVFAQKGFFEPSDTLNGKRLFYATGVTGVAYTGAIIGLNELWYKQYPRSSFQFFNDNTTWLQMDKLGHSLTAYQVGRLGYEVMRWSGVEEKPSVWIGGNLGLFFLTTLEMLDAYSAEWGFSWGDCIANVAGTSLFIGQQLAWGEQRMALKFSYSASEYAQYRPETLGSGGIESLLKDYNGQTIWLSVNPSSFSKEPTPFLPWLSVSFGYSANGMLGGSGNPELNSAGEVLPDLNRYRQYLLSFDVDLTRIPVKSHFLRTVFSTIGFIKVPAPAIEFSQGNVQWHWLYF
jgi:hypothetical protein